MQQQDRPPQQVFSGLDAAFADARDAALAIPDADARFVYLTQLAELVGGFAATVGDDRRQTAIEIRRIHGLTVRGLAERAGIGLTRAQQLTGKQKGPTE